MSFDYDPYSGMELSLDSSVRGWKWHCPSCGGGWNTIPKSDLEELWEDWLAHLRNSHRLTAEDTEDWSKLE